MISTILSFHKTSFHFDCQNDEKDDTATTTRTYAR